MVVLEEAALGAASDCAVKRALALVALPDCTLHGRGDMAACIAMRCPAWPIDGPVPTLAQLSDQQGQRTLEDEGDVAVGNLMPQQILRLAQLLMRLAGHGELDFVEFRRERPDLRACPRLLDCRLKEAWRPGALSNGRGQGRRVCMIDR